MASPVPTASVYNVKASYAQSNITVSTEHRSESPAGAAGMKAAQLQALLHMTCGEAFEVFTGAADDLRQNLLFLATDLANEVRALCDLAVEADR